MGYRSNALASGLRTSKSFTLGVIVPRLNSNFMSTVLAGMEKAAIEEGYHLIIMQSFESEEKEKECAQLLFNHRVDGLLVSTSSSSQSVKYFDPFFKKRIPVVFFDRIPAGTNDCNTITINNTRAGYELSKILLENGCQCLLHITGNTKLLVYQQRLNGFKQALAEYNKPFSPEKVWTTNLNVEDGEKAAEKILKMKKLPDAIFVANDTCAITVIHHLQKKGIRIPEQVQVTGFNNDPFSALLTPGLTTVKYPGTEMGIKSVQTLLSLIENPKDKPVHKQLDFELMKRESTKIKNAVL